MKFFHLSDLHIGLKLYNRDLSADHRYVMAQILDLLREHQPDAVVIAGDIYDKPIPSAEAVTMFDWFVSGMAEAAPNAELMFISGNHDSAPRVDLYRELLAKHHVHMIGQPPRLPGENIAQLTLTDEFGPVHFYLLPFVKPSMVRAIVGAEQEEPLTYDQAVRRLISCENICTDERNVLVSHQFYLPGGNDADKLERMASEIQTVGNVDQVGTDVLSVFDYAALGHIHKPWKLGDDFHRYCGTPLPCSVDEAGQTKGAILVEMRAKGDITATVCPLTPLHAVRKITGTLEELLAASSQDYVSITLTDEKEVDPVDTLDRLRNAFPNYLEIRRALTRTVVTQEAEWTEAERDPYELCLDFLPDLDDGEKSLLLDMLNTVKGGV